jgi:hypothetical protein
VQQRPLHREEGSMTRKAPSPVSSGARFCAGLALCGCLAAGAWAADPPKPAASAAARPASGAHKAASAPHKPASATHKAAAATPAGRPASAPARPASAPKVDQEKINRLLTAARLLETEGHSASAAKLYAEAAAAGSEQAQQRLDGMVRDNGRSEARMRAMCVTAC